MNMEGWPWHRKARGCPGFLPKSYGRVVHCSESFPGTQK